MECHVNRRLLPFKLFYFFFYGGHSCLTPFLPHFLQQSKGLSAVDVTTILGAVPFLVVISKPVLGHIADRSQAFRSVLGANLLVGLVFMCLLLPAPALPPSAAAAANASNQSLWTEPDETHFTSPEFWLLFGLIVVGNVGGLRTAYTIADALTLNTLAHMGRTRDYGRQRMWMSAGLGAALLTVALVMDSLTPSPGRVDYTPAFAGFVLALACSAVTVVFLPAPPPPTPPPLPSKYEDLLPPSGAPSLSSGPPSPRDSLASSSDAATVESAEGGGLCSVLPEFARPARAWFALMAFVCGANFGTAVWMTPFYLKVDLASSQTGIGLAVVSVCVSTMAAFFISGHMLDCVGPEAVQGLCLVLYSLRSLLWSLVGSWGWASVCVEALLGAAIGLWLPTMGAYAAALTDAPSRASAQAILSAVYDGFGVGVGNVVSGRLYAMLGGCATWRAMSAGTFLCAGLHWALLLASALRKRRRTKTPF